MKSEISLFRTLLWVQISLVVIVAISFVMGDNLPEPLHSYNQMENERSSMGAGILSAVYLVAALIVFIGQIMLRPWAKHATLFVYVGSTAMTFFGPPIVAPGAAGAFCDLATMASGAILFMLYFTEFGRNWASLRKRV